MTIVVVAKTKGLGRAEMAFLEGFRVLPIPHQTTTHTISWNVTEECFGPVT